MMSRALTVDVNSVFSFWKEDRQKEFLASNHRQSLCLGKKIVFPLFWTNSQFWMGIQLNLLLMEVNGRETFLLENKTGSSLI